MNILYVGFFELPDKDAAANRVMNNAKALVDSGHNVIFIDEKKLMYRRMYLLIKVIFMTWMYGLH